MNRPLSSNSRSLKSSGTRISDLEERDFEQLMAEIYKRFCCQVSLAINREYQIQYNGSMKSQKVRASRVKQKQASVLPTDIDTDTTTVTDVESKVDPIYRNYDKVLPVTAVYDSQNHLAELLIGKYQQYIIPRILIQMLSLVLNHYSQLNKFSVKYCRIDVYFLHELSKVLPYTTITDVCLDDCPLNRANYELLLQKPSRLKSLSLCRNNINDEVCKRLASKLCFLESAENHLVTLNLSSNRIGDEGVKHLAEALRTNRHLRYLNLADNHIGDDGAKFIFNTLIEFPLTYEENMDRRRRFMIYLKYKQGVYVACLRNLEQNIGVYNSVPKKTTKGRGSIDKGSKKMRNLNESPIFTPEKAELMTKELVGPFKDPFCPSSIIIRDGYPHCIGNFVLCYLNIAYNDLTFASIKKLLSVVEYQDTTVNNLISIGLMKTILVGNQIPVDCKELSTISQILSKNFPKFQEKSWDVKVQTAKDTVRSSRKSAK